MYSITVIIATYNRSQALAEALKSLAAQEQDGSFDFDVIVLDNNSSDNTKAVVEFLKPLFKDKIQYLFEGQQGKSYALNRGIEAATGDIIAFTDDDVNIDSKWLLNLKRCFEQTGCDGCGGRILPVYPEDTPQWLRDNLDILRGNIVIYDYGEKTLKYEKPLIEFLGANYAFRKEMFQECGVFRSDLGTGRPPLGEDTEFVCRLEALKKKMYYCGGALVWHPVDLRRAGLRFIARWNIALGRFRVIKDDKGTITQDLVYYFGVPRYLIRVMLETCLGLLFNVFNRREFLMLWIRLWRNWGRAIEFRIAYQAMKTSSLPTGESQGDKNGT